MLEYHVYGPADTEPTIVHEGMIDAYLAENFSAADHVRVFSMRVIHEMTLLYNGPGGIPLPTAPSNPPASKTVQITHVMKK